MKSFIFILIENNYNILWLFFLKMRVSQNSDDITTQFTIFPIHLQLIADSGGSKISQPFTTHTIIKMLYYLWQDLLLIGPYQQTK